MLDRDFGKVRNRKLVGYHVAHRANSIFECHLVNLKYGLVRGGDDGDNGGGEFTPVAPRRYSKRWRA